MKKNIIKQPFLVGTKEYKSLAITLPADLVKKYHINQSTGFILKHDKAGIILRYIHESKNMIPVDNNSLAAKDQQVSIIKGLD